MKSPLLLTGLVSLSLSHSAVIAEDSEPDGIKKLSSVIVTGQKLERTQLETVSSVHIVDSEEINDGTHMDDLYDVVEATPNVSNTSGFNSLSIRGIANSGPTNADNGAGTIGIYIDNGLQTARSIQNNALSTWDVDRIEILRGPQSTTSGRNSLAGQIVIHTKDPDFDSNGAARLSFGEYMTTQTSIMQTGPLTDNFAYRLTADFQASENFVENDFFGVDDFNQDKNTNLRGKFLYLTPNDGELLLTLSHNNYREDGDAAVDDRQNGRKSRLNFPSEWETDNNTVSIKYTQPLSDTLSFESNTGYVNSDFARNTDFDGSPGDALLEQQTDEYNFNQELLIRYEANRIRSVVGLYFAKGKLDDQYFTNNVSLGFPGIPFTLLLNSGVSTKEEFTTAALFADVDFKLTDKLILLAGLRADHEKRESDVSTTIARAISYGFYDPTIDAGLAGLIGPGLSEGDKSSFNLLPKLGLNYLWSDTLSTGFVVQRGYRPGGVSTNPIRGQVSAYDEEFTTHYEGSLRAQLFDEQLLINANVFYTDWKDQQVTIASAGAIHPLDQTIENAGQSHIYGFELETHYTLNPNWTLLGGIGYAKTEFDEFTSNGIDYSGQEFQFARDWTANVASTYRLSNGWFANGNLSYASKGADRLGIADTELDAYTLVNVKVGYEQDQWGVYLFANNLLDKEYRKERFNSTSNYGNAIYGDPRVVGLVATINW